MTTKTRTPKAKATTPVTLTLTSRQLADLVTLVRPFTGRDDTLPMLMQYRLQVDAAGDLWVYGTDRYTLAAYRIPPTDEQPHPAGLDVSVPTALFDRALMLWKPPRRGKASPSFDVLRITVTADGVTVEDAQRTGRVTTAVDRQIFAPLPDCAGLIAQSVLDASNPKPASVYSLDPVFLARIGVAEKLLHEQMTVFVAEARKPVLFTVGDTFAALVMPRNRYGTRPLADDLKPWQDRTRAALPEQPKQATA